MIYLLKEYGDFLELMERIFNCRIQIITGPNNEISQQQQKTYIRFHVTFPIGTFSRYEI